MGCTYRHLVPPPQCFPGDPFGQFDLWEQHLHTPIGVLGLGISLLEERFRAATDRLIERAEFFLVRDLESQRILDHPKVQVAADLTFYEPIDAQASETSRDPLTCGVNLRPAHTGIGDWIEAVRSLPYPIRAIPLSSHPSLGDRDALLPLDPQCPSRFSLQDLREIDLLVGTAFHSIVFAIQSQKPVVAINYDPKVERLMEAVGLHDYLLNWNAAAELNSCVEQALTKRSEVRKRMLDFTAEAKNRLREALREPLSTVSKRAAHVANSRSRPVPQPLVSVIVRGENVTEEEARKTLSSCYAQTHRNLEVVLVLQEAEAARFMGLLDEFPKVRMIRMVDRPNQWAATALASVSGAYVTLVNMGSWFTEDAIALLLVPLEENQDIDLVHASFFLTTDGIIERKVTLDSPQRPGHADRIGPCALVRRGKARSILEDWAYDPKSIHIRRLARSYIRSCLFYQPATERESHLYRSLMAFGRGDIPLAQKLFGKALGPDNAFTDPDELAQVSQLIAATAPNAQVTTDPLTFVNLVLDNLPKGSPNAVLLRKKTIGQLMATQLFATQAERNGSKSLRLAWASISNDPTWIRNTGMWAVVFRSFLKKLLPGKRKEQTFAG